LIFVPSSANRPTFNNPDADASFNTSTNNFSNAATCRRNVPTTKLADRMPVTLYQRQAGVSSPTITRHATSCSHRCMIFRDDRVPVA